MQKFGERAGKKSHAKSFTKLKKVPSNKQMTPTKTEIIFTQESKAGIHHVTLDSWN